MKAVSAIIAGCRLVGHENWTIGWWRVGHGFWTTQSHSAKRCMAETPVGQGVEVAVPPPLAGAWGGG